MHHSDRGLSLTQISADAAHGLIVGVAVTQEANDSAQLLPAVDRLEERLKKKPQQMVADGGYTTREQAGHRRRKLETTGRTNPQQSVSAIDKNLTLRLPQ